MVLAGVVFTGMFFQEGLFFKKKFFFLARGVFSSQVFLFLTGVKGCFCSRVVFFFFFLKLVVVFFLKIMVFQEIGWKEGVLGRRDFWGKERFFLGVRRKVQDFSFLGSFELFFFSEGIFKVWFCTTSVFNGSVLERVV